LTVDRPAAPAVEVRDLRFRYRKNDAPVLDLPRFDVAPRERVFVRGASGSGKTTLLSLLAGVLVADAGMVRVAGHDWKALAPAARDRLRAERIGYVFQQFNLLPWLAVLDNVLLPCRFSSERARRAGATAAEREATALTLLARLGLDRTLAARDASTLSVGQQQRVAAARALVGRPELVIADEPTSALDEAARAAFMEVLLGAVAEAGSALVFVSHDARLAADFDRTVEIPSADRGP
jgi:putative ABC transport system ATP-binding protein